jgi:DNA-binding beta-propeller fold protein YncE
LKARKLLTVIRVSGKTQRISLSADDKFAFTADQTHPRLAVIDTATNTVSRWIALPALGYGTASTPDARWLLVAIPSASAVAIVDLHTFAVARTIAVAAHPTEILIRPDGATAYVACGDSHQVAAIGIPQWKLAALIQAGNGADGMSWSN